MKRPNIVVILTDQQSATMMSCTGNRHLETPAMDWLAENGVQFDRTYVTNPVCLPSRFSLQTGCYPSRVSVRGNKDGNTSDPFPDFERNTLGHRMRSAGYTTAYGGKVHLPSGSGMDDVAKLGYEVISKDEREQLARDCASFIHRDHNKPFFLFASFINPHDICYMAINDYRRTHNMPLKDNPGARVCEEMLAQAPTNEDDLPPLPGTGTTENLSVSRNEPGSVVEFLKKRPFKYHARNEWDEKKWRLHRWLYCRLTEQVDRQIGMVLEALEESQELENTIVIFTSDHGDMDGAHRMEHKSVFYEQAIRVPFIVTQKGKTSPRNEGRYIVNNGLDLFPTLCDYAGIAPPAGLLGASIRPLVEGKKPDQWREDCLIESELGWYLITKCWKYCSLDVEGSEEALYNIAEDPDEIHNLAADPACKNTLEECRNKLAEKTG